MQTTARVKTTSEYNWFRFTGKRNIVLTHTNNKTTIHIEPNDVYGLRPSSNGKQFRLITKKTGLTKVFTIPQATYEKLATQGKPVRASKLNVEYKVSAGVELSVDVADRCIRALNKTVDYISYEKPRYADAMIEAQNALVFMAKNSNAPADFYDEYDLVSVLHLSVRLALCLVKIVSDEQVQEDTEFFKSPEKFLSVFHDNAKLHELFERVVKYVRPVILKQDQMKMQNENASKVVQSSKGVDTKYLLQELDVTADLLWGAQFERAMKSVLKTKKFCASNFDSKYDLPEATQQEFVNIAKRTTKFIRENKWLVEKPELYTLYKGWINNTESSIANTHSGNAILSLLNLVQAFLKAMEKEPK